MLANMILDNIGEEGQIKRKVYQRRLPENPSQDYYYIIRETNPAESVLIEYGFIDNPNDLKKLQNNLTNYAEGVVKALSDYLDVPYTAPGDVVLPENGQYYIVQNGDTLYSIANRFGLTVNELKELNNLTSDIISVGQQLLINPNVTPEQGEFYIVQKGDTLYSIANRFGLTVNELKRLNNLTSDIISVGQQLLINPNGTNNQNKIYIVQKGDSLWSIARKYNISVDSLIKYNNLSNLTLQIGQQLLIPDVNSDLDNDIYYTVQTGDKIFMGNNEYNIKVLLEFKTF